MCIYVNTYIHTYTYMYVYVCEYRVRDKNNFLSNIIST